MVTLDQVPRYVVIFVVIAFILGIGATLLTEVQGTQTGNGTAYNITGQGLTALTTIGNWQSILAIAVISIVVIGIVSVFLQPRAMA